MNAHEDSFFLRRACQVALALLLVLVLALASCSRSPTQTQTQTAPPSSAAVVVGSSSSLAPPQVDPPGVYMGRTMAQPMSYLGADWLDRADRDATQQPEHVLDVLHVTEGQTVADIGCGTGYFTVHLSKRVGPRGRVIGTDLQKEMLDLLKKRLDKEKIGNVTSILATPEDAKLPREIDLVLMVDVYHEVPNPPLTLAQIKASLSKNGRLALVEYRAEDPKVEIKPEHKTTLVQLRRELEANGWVFLSSDESLPEQRIVQFKPSSPVQ